MSLFKINDDCKLVLFKPTGTLTYDTIKDYVNKVRSHGAVTIKYNRFMDLTALYNIQLDYYDIRRIGAMLASIRKLNKGVKSCVLYSHIGQNKIAHLVVSKMGPEIRDFLFTKKFEEGAEYLGVALEILKSL